MKIIGITGGIGSGKSEVLNILNGIDGVFVIEADKLAHKLMEPGNEAYEKIIKEFGENIKTDDGFIDRSKLGAIVMNDSEKLARLNMIVHPAVKEYIIDDISLKEKEGMEFYVIEAALLIQDGYKEICDEIWYIHVDREERIKRLMQGRGLSREKAEEFMNNQPEDSFYADNSDMIIDNNGSIEAMKTMVVLLLSE